MTKGSLESGWREPDDAPGEICWFKKWHLWKPSKNIRNVLEQMECEEHWTRTILWKSKDNKCGKGKGLQVINDHLYDDSIILFKLHM